MDYFSGAGNVSGQFVDGTTRLPASWLNAVQTEIITVIEAGGLTPDAGNSTQLAAAIAALIGAVAAVPTGTVQFYAAETAPAGWLICDGSVVSRSEYAALFSVIGTTYGAGDGSTTFALPDARGLFFRAWSAGSAPDAGRVFGSTQTSSPGDHTHIAIAVRDDGNTGGTTRPTVVKTTASVAGDVSDWNANNPIGNPVDAAGAPLASETRPSNMALLAIIKT